MTSPQPPRDSARFRIVVVAVLAVAATLFTIAALTAETDSEDTVAQTGEAAEFVDALFPKRDAQVVQQVTIGIDLAPGWDGTLVIDDIEVPEDQLTKRRDLYQVLYTPGEGKVVEELPAGPNCVAAIVWRLTDGRGPASRTVRWCFDVV